MSKPVAVGAEYDNVLWLIAFLSSSTVSITGSLVPTAVFTLRVIYALSFCVVRRSIVAHTMMHFTISVISCFATVYPLIATQFTTTRKLTFSSHIPPF